MEISRKQFFLITSIFVAFVLLILLVSSLTARKIAFSPTLLIDNLVNNKNEIIIEDLSTVDTNFVESHNQFANRLLSNTVRDKNTKDVFISPSGAYIALSMLANGAEAASKEELAQALQMDNIDLVEVNSNVQLFQEYFNSLNESSDMQTNIVNGLWVKDINTINSTYTMVLKDFFSAEIGNLFTNDASNINEWASNNTNQKIEQLLQDSEIQEKTKVVLTNAIYFNADWQYKFDDISTGTFNKVNPSEGQVQYMHQVNNFNYAQSSFGQHIELPYKSNFAKMRIHLPNKVMNSNQIMSTFVRPEDYSNTKVVLDMPKFVIEDENYLDDALKQMGLDTIYTDQADLTALSDLIPLQLSFVKQKAYVSVSETGTEAAAATAVGVSITSVEVDEPVEFIVDRPFMFEIVESQTGLIIFSGIVHNPPAFIS